MSVDMMSVSTVQALGLWEDLLSALYGDNGYGGDVAEIYVYRMMPHSPAATQPLVGIGIDAYRGGCRALHGFCRLFEERQSAVVSFDDGTSLDALLDDEPHTHRVHLRVSRRD